MYLTWSDMMFSLFNLLVLDICVVVAVVMVMVVVEVIIYVHCNAVGVVARS